MNGCGRKTHAVAAKTDDLSTLFFGKHARDIGLKFAHQQRQAFLAPAWMAHRIHDFNTRRLRTVRERDPYRIGTLRRIIKATRIRFVFMQRRFGAQRIDARIGGDSIFTLSNAGGCLSCNEVIKNTIKTNTYVIFTAAEAGHLKRKFASSHIAARDFVPYPPPTRATIRARNVEERMVRLRYGFAISCATVMWAASLPVLAQDPSISSGQAYPNKLVRIATLAPGGGSDVVARLIAPVLSEGLGQQVIVENRGSIAGEIVAKAPADGYTLLVEGTPLWILPLFRSVPWDALKDFAPITLIISTPNVLVVDPSLPVKSVKELIALARARPGQLNYAAGTLGANPHLAAELFKSMAGVNIVQVAYKGTGPGLIGLF